MTCRSARTKARHASPTFSAGRRRPKAPGRLTRYLLTFCQPIPGPVMIPGEILTHPGDMELNAGLPRTTLTVANTGDRPIQVGSHYHFAETNPALSFDRTAARGQRLDIAAGTAVRFEPGPTREVTLVPPTAAAPPPTDR